MGRGTVKARTKANVKKKPKKRSGIGDAGVMTAKLRTTLKQKG
jgi:hypothetical protein